MTKKHPSLESAYQKLQKIVEEIQDPDTDLDQAMSKYQTGMELVEFIQSQLKKYELKIEEVKSKFSPD